MTEEHDLEWALSALDEIVIVSSLDEQGWGPGTLVEIRLHFANLQDHKDAEDEGNVQTMKDGGLKLMEKLQRLNKKLRFINLIFPPLQDEISSWNRSRIFWGGYETEETEEKHVDLGQEHENHAIAQTKNEFIERLSTEQKRILYRSFLDALFMLQIAFSKDFHMKSSAITRFDRTSNVNAQNGIFRLQGPFRYAAYGAALSPFLYPPIAWKLSPVIARRPWYVKYPVTGGLAVLGGAAGGFGVERYLGYH